MYQNLFNIKLNNKAYKKFEYLNLETNRSLKAKKDNKIKRLKLDEDCNTIQKLKYLNLEINNAYLNGKMTHGCQNKSDISYGTKLRVKGNIPMKQNRWENPNYKQNLPLITLNNRKRKRDDHNFHIKNTFIGESHKIKINNDKQQYENKNILGFSIKKTEIYVTYNEKLNRIIKSDIRIPKSLEENPRKYINLNKIKVSNEWETKNIEYVKNCNKASKKECPLIQIRAIKIKTANNVQKIKLIKLKGDVKSINVQKFSLISVSLRDHKYFEYLEQEDILERENSFGQRQESYNPNSGLGLDPTFREEECGFERLLYQSDSRHESKYPKRYNWLTQFCYQCVKKSKRKTNQLTEKMEKVFSKYSDQIFIIMGIVLTYFILNIIYKIEIEVWIKIFIFLIGLLMGKILIFSYEKLVKWYKHLKMTISVKKKEEIPNKRRYIANKKRMKKFKFKKYKNRNMKTKYEKKMKEKIKLINIQGKREFTFPIFYNNNKMIFEVDTGSEFCVASIDYISKFIPDLEKYFYKENTVKMVVANNEPLDVRKVYKIPFYLPEYGHINVDIRVAYNATNLFIFGREFMKKTGSILKVNKNSKKVELKFCEGKIPNLKLNREIDLDGFESKIYVGKIQNGNMNSNYDIKNNKKYPVKFSKIKDDGENFVFEAKNLLSIPVVYNFGSITLIETEEGPVYASGKMQNAEAETHTMLDSVCPSWLTRLTEIKNYIKANIFKISEEKDNKQILEEKESIEEFKNRTGKNDGIDISQLLEIKNLSVQQIADLMKTGDISGNLEIAKFLYDLELYSKHTFDCGKLNEHIPKLDVRVKENFVKNTKPYNLTPSDQTHVTNFFNLLLKYNLVEVAPQDQSFGAPVFCIKTRADGSGLPRIIADMRLSNMAIETNKQATLPDYKQLLEKLISKAKYVSSFDLKKCYYSIPLSEKTKNSGIFNVILPTGVYRFNCAITGLNVVPAYLIQTLLKFIHLDENNENDYIHDLLVFMDDIIITSDGDLEDHILKVKKVLQRLKRIGVKISPEKAYTCIDIDKGEIELLGFKIKIGSSVFLIRRKIL